MKENRKTLIGCLCALGCETIFGFSSLFTKDVTETVSPFALLGWRFLTAFVTLSLCASCGLIKINLKGKNLKPLFALALFSPILYFTGETFGIALTTASESGAVFACIPVASVLASTLILKKSPRKNEIIGILLTLIGVLITVFAAGRSASFSLPGYLMLFMAVLSDALYGVSVEKTSDYGELEKLFVILFAGAIFFSFAAVAEASINGNLSGLVVLPFRSSRVMAAVLYQGIGCSIFAFFLYNTAISQIGVNRVSSYIGVCTIVSILSGVLILRERFTIAQLIGVLIITIGVYIANSRF